MKSEPLNSYKQTFIWLLLNAFGIVIYLWLESQILAPRPEGESLNGIDQIHLWVTTNFPVLVIFFLLNLVWLIRSQKPIAGAVAKQWYFWSFVVGGWVVALLYRGLVVKILCILILMISGRAWK